MTGRRLGPADFAALSAAEAASYWFVRQDAGEMSDDDSCAFEQWLTSSTRHRAAFDRARSVWREFEGPADRIEFSAMRAAALADSRKPTRRLQIAAAIAAACVVSILAVTFGWKQRLMTAATDSPTQHLRAPRNERMSADLSDGTVVSLNADAALDVAYTAGERRVDLLRGEAFFQVAKNSKRPFSVIAADRRITALGTQFDVRLDPGWVEVVLLEGKVAVDHTSNSIVDFLAGHKQHFELRPGQRLVAATGEPPAVADADAQKLTSWRQGLLVFDDDTLARAVGELNRYASKPIVVSDAVRELRLSGVFRIGEPQRFAAVIQELLPVRAVQDSEGGTVLLPAAARDKPGPVH